MKKMIMPIIPFIPLIENGRYESARIDGILFYILEYMSPISGNPLMIGALLAVIIIISYIIFRWYHMEG